MLAVDNLSGGYGRLEIVHGVSLSVNEGEITVIVGPNGSGKSTLLKCCTGLADVFSGGVTNDGVKLVGLPVYEVAKRGVVYLPQTKNVFGGLTLKENIVISSYLHKENFKARMEDCLSLFPSLKDNLDRKANTLSGGERQMLSMAMGLMRSPQVMLIDEPTAALAPKAVADVLNRIVELKEKLKIAIILVEQNAEKALELADKACLLVAGKILFSGQPKELLEHRELSRLYLGALDTTA